MTHPVVLYVYDLSQGMARSLGPALGLHDLEGVWHTAIVVHNTEIFFGGSGIEHCSPGTTMLGQPLQKIPLGNTSIEMSALSDYIRNIGQTEFHGTRYDLFKHNCNNFSSCLAKFLSVQDVPQHILDLPNKVLSSPIAAMLKPIIEQATPDGQGTSFGNSNGFPSSSSGGASARPSEKFFHYPPKEYSVINPSIDIDKVMSKLMDFNEKNASKFAIKDDHLTTLRLLNEEGVKVEEEVIKLLGQILTNWPKQDTFPILNIICCNVVREGIPKESTSLLYKLFKSHKMLSKDSPPTRMCLRILVNCFAKESSRSVMLQNREELIGDLNSFLEEADNEISPQVENAVASLASNYAKAIYDQGGDAEASFQLVSGLSTVYLGKIKGPEALFKIVVSLATLISLDVEVKGLAEALEVKNELTKIPKGRMERLDQCVKECVTLLS